MGFFFFIASSSFFFFLAGKRDRDFRRRPVSGGHFEAIPRDSYARRVRPQYFRRPGVVFHADLLSNFTT